MTQRPAMQAPTQPQPSASYLMGWLKLGRISNLPTVWSNALCGIALGLVAANDGSAVVQAQEWVLPLTFSLLLFSGFYIGGMFLNDAFDAGVDAIERPERPIPSGLIKRSHVFVAGFGLLTTGTLGAVMLAKGSSNIPVFLSALALSGFITLYNLWHKSNPASPLIMGICRVLIYVTAALIVGVSSVSTLALGGLALLSYLIGLTAIAKQENHSALRSQWPLLPLFVPVLVAFMLAEKGSLALVLCSLALVVWVLHIRRILASQSAGAIPLCVGRLIAGISLVDMLLLAALFYPGLNHPLAGTGLLWLSLCLVCFFSTLLFQRVVPGT